MQLLKDIPDNSVDLILCDPPYGTTDCTWDNVIQFDKLWTEYRRVLKINGVAALFCAQPFTTRLIYSNLKDFRYCWYWVKNNVTGFSYARYQPMRRLEEIAVFILNAPGKNNKGKHMRLREYMFTELRKSGKTRTDINRALGSVMTSHYFTNGQQFEIPTEAVWEKLQDFTGCFQRPYADILAEYQQESGGGNPGVRTFTYNPHGLVEIPPEQNRVTIRHKKEGEHIYAIDRLSKPYTKKYTNWPKNVLYFDNEFGMHPTQKPVALLEYLVRTYTNEGDTVLDNCMGSGSTGVAVKRVGGRRFIGMEYNREYFEIAQERINNEVTQ